MNGGDVYKYMLDIDSHIAKVWDENVAIGRGIESVLVPFHQWREQYDAFRKDLPISDEGAADTFVKLHTWAIQLEGNPDTGELGWRQRLDLAAHRAVSAPGEYAVPSPAPPERPRLHWGWKVALGLGAAVGLYYLFKTDDAPVRPVLIEHEDEIPVPPSIARAAPRPRHAALPEAESPAHAPEAHAPEAHAPEAPAEEALAHG